MLRAGVILAAGKGERIWPFAEVRNKCAVPVANVPNVRRLAQALARAGLERIVVVVRDHASTIRHALAPLTPEPVCVLQPNNTGTAGAALVGMQALSDEPHVLVVYGDVVTPEETVVHFIRSWASSGAAGAILYDEIHPAEGADWYGVRLDGERVQQVIGHDSGQALRWCGMAIVPQRFAHTLERNPGRMLAVPVGGMPPLEPDLAQSLNDFDGDLIAVRAPHFVVDMDKPWHILEANVRMAEYLCTRLNADHLGAGSSIHDGADIHGRVVLGEGSHIGKRVLVSDNIIVGSGTTITNGAILQGNNVIGDRTSIRDYCLVGCNTVVGSNCIVGHGAEIDGVMFDGSYLYHYCEISGVVGQSVDIGAATVCGTLRFDDGLSEHRIRGRRERPLSEANATFFGDHSRTGVNVVTMPGVKIGAYSCVGAGIIVYEDVPSRTLLLLKQETVTRPWGPERYGW